ncbi:MAG: hypothetical protein L6Q71_05555 [Planctomycetes bacterium]|nr:hypothetical protein [Planctomycetota bacterium]NUQ34129.1 hypothetical protein [Planctomycetaceae bacterium]
MKPIYIALLACILAACGTNGVNTNTASNAPAQQPPANPLATSSADAAKYHGQIVTLRGAFDRGAEPGVRGRYASIAGVFLGDGVPVENHDEWVEKANGKTVEAVGRIIKSTPSEYDPDRPEFTRQWIVAPHLIDITAIKIVE